MVLAGVFLLFVLNDFLTVRGYHHFDKKLINVYNYVFYST